MTTRRKFIKSAAMGTAALSLSNILLPKNSYANLLGSNETVNVAFFGLGGRAGGLVQSIARCKYAKVTHICDVDQKRTDKFKKKCEEWIGYIPTAEKDYRKLLSLKEIDAVVIATPEHLHATMAIEAMQAGKHVYVEKPCSHNPYENELIVAVQKKYNKVCQMGNQQRSAASSALAMKEIKDGIIGDVYMGKAWYSNTRGSIGKGKVVPVPDHLDWDLWQGPAPREEFRDNIHPYNWHWFKTWGTGEIHNNGTHEIDICRWALGVKYPNRVVSAGGRLHFTEDDWEFYDTQMSSYEFEEGKSITWEGRSCNGFHHYGTGRGATIHGTKGTILLDREKYVLFDDKGKEVKREKEADQGTSNSTADLTGFGGLTVLHILNFINAIRKDEKLHSPIADAAISTHICHLGNIAQELEESLRIDTNTGKVLNNKNADKLWKREYEKGWEPTL